MSEQSIWRRHGGATLCLQKINNKHKTIISDGYGDYMGDAFVRASDRLSLNRLGIITMRAVELSHT